MDGKARSLCPFNSAHSILNHRISVHVAACRAQYKDVPVMRCVYNANHWFPVSEREEHEKTCEARSHLTRELYTVGGGLAPVVPQHVEISANDDTENWDSVTEPGQRSYLAVKDEQLKQKPIILNGPTNLSKAARKRFLQEEKARHRQFTSLQKN